MVAVPISLPIVVIPFRTIIAIITVIVLMFMEVLVMVCPQP